MEQTDPIQTQPTGRFCWRIVQWNRVRVGPRRVKLAAGSLLTATQVLANP